MGNYGGNFIFMSEHADHGHGNESHGGGDKIIDPEGIIVRQGIIDNISDAGTQALDLFINTFLPTNFGGKTAKKNHGHGAHAAHGHDDHHAPKGGHGDNGGHH
jgi:hypothetical protein